MSLMPHPRPPYLIKRITRHGVVTWYVWKRPNPSVRLRATYGTPQFYDEYNAALRGERAAKPDAKTPEGSVAWLIARYRESGAWLNDLSEATRRQRDNIFVHVLELAGRDPYRNVTRKTVIASRDARISTPAQARNFLDAMRGLFRWALEKEHVNVDPTAGVKNPKRKKGKGFPIWSEEEVDRYYDRWPIGTKERVWIDVLLYTGMRRGDAVQFGRQHVRNGFAHFFTEKSGEMIPVTLPILPVLKATLDAGPTGELLFICGSRGQPFVKESFGNAFKEACVAAGILDKSAHGLRKVGATRAAEKGATVSELDALFGWISGGGMSALYTRSADRARLGKRAGAMLAKTEENEAETAMLPPEGEVVTLAKKSLP
jgi:integrase